MGADDLVRLAASFDEEAPRNTLESAAYQNFVAVLVANGIVWISLLFRSSLLIWPFKRFLVLRKFTYNTFLPQNTLTIVLKKFVWVTSWLRTALSTFLGKLMVSQLVKRFLAFYGTLNFSAKFTRAPLSSLSSARSMKSTPSYFMKEHFNVILPPTCGSSWWSLSIGFTHQTRPCELLL